MTDVGLTLAVKDQWDNGDKLLSFFDCELLGLRLNGCLLIRASRGHLLAQAPRGDSQRPGLRAIQIIDPSFRAALADTAHRAFLAIGGAE